ncbi:hypothetical protein HYZ97_04460 [Candidatus Pacearchaeota archaeon]|nr:hypothetical protein [Candidatus Pacearchaeota archaeon]
MKAQARSKMKYLAVLLTIVAIFIINLSIETGIFQKSKIDSRDLKYWSYDESEFIENASAFSIEGDNETCWLLIHSYVATPLEMSELAHEINIGLNHTVFVPLLEGHSQVPSELLGKNLDYWYLQISEELLKVQRKCNKVNVLGSSLSVPIVLKLAEENELNAIFALNSFIYMPYKVVRVLPLRTFIYLFTPFVHYNKKIEIAQINNPEGREIHVAYWNMPYQPIRDSFQFIDESRDNLNKIDEPVFIAHSMKDPTAGKKSAEVIYENVNSGVKELKWYNNSSHVLLLDYDKIALIRDIINFGE